MKMIPSLFHATCGMLVILSAGCAGVPLADSPAQRGGEEMGLAPSRIPEDAANSAPCEVPVPFFSRPQNVTEKRQRQAAERIRQFEANRAFAEHQAALARWNQGDLKGARERLEGLLRRNGDHVEARLLLADVYLSEDRYADAERQVQQALATDPESVEALYMMGLVLDITGETARAMSHYARAAELDPHSEVYASAATGAIRPRRDCTLPVSEDADLAASTYDAAAPRPCRVADDDALPIELVSLDQPMAEPRTAGEDRLPPKPVVIPSGGDSALALPPASDFEEPTATDHAEDTARNESAGRHGNTTAAYLDADTDTPPQVGPAVDIDALLARASAAMSQGRVDRAAAIFRQAAAQEPHNRQIPILGAVESLRQNQPALAVELLAPLADEGRSSARLYRILGTAHYRLGDFRASETALRQALSLDKSSALTYFLMGCTLAKLGESDAAEGHFRQARLIDPRYTAGR